MQFHVNMQNIMEAPGIDPGTSRMLSERSTIWATPPMLNTALVFYQYIQEFRSDLPHIFFVFVSKKVGHEDFLYVKFLILVCLVAHFE